MISMERESERRGLDPSAVHALSNHLAVILGFIELVLADTSSDDPRRGDLEEIQQAANECAQIITKSQNDFAE
jgi:hypothetical protein